MQGYWMKFTDGSEGYCEGETKFDAKMNAEHFTKKTVAGGQYQDIEAEGLPYPAQPIIWQFDHPRNGKCPDFCYSPKTCKGKSSCPKNPSCTS